MSDGLLHHFVSGHHDAPPVLLGPSLGTSSALWDGVVPMLSADHRLVRWDLPGHGRSPAALLPSAPNTATVADLGRLVLAFADARGFDHFGYAGVSLSGAVGLWLAVHHPDRLSSLTLVCSAARFGPADAWRERADLVRRAGTQGLLDRVRAGWFTPSFSGSGRALRLLDDLMRTDRSGYAACCDALASYDLRAALPEVTVPTLVIAGREDPATPVALARELADGIPGAGLCEIAHTRHLAIAQAPSVVGSALRAHLTTTAAPRGTARGVPPRTDAPSGPGEDKGATYAAGAAVRRAVLGDAHVDRAERRFNDFNARFQDFITRYAWGEIWADPVLTRREHSLITLTALVARGQYQELAWHVRAALRGGLSADEISALLMQCAVYCGVPAANSAFSVAERVLNEEGGARGPSGPSGDLATSGPPPAAGPPDRAARGESVFDDARSEATIQWATGDEPERTRGAHRRPAAGAGSSSRLSPADEGGGPARSTGVGEEATDRRPTAPRAGDPSHDQDGSEPTGGSAGRG